MKEKYYIIQPKNKVLYYCFLMFARYILHITHYRLHFAYCVMGSVCTIICNIRIYEIVQLKIKRQKCQRRKNNVTNYFFFKVRWHNTSLIKKMCNLALI